MTGTSNEASVTTAAAPTPAVALAPPAYSAIAHVIGHTFTASAAMLAFFFVFQGTLLANFPTLYEKFSQATLPGLGHFPIGRAALVILCLLALAFTGWSCLIVRLFITYFDSFIASGTALESDGKLSGLFAALHSASKAAMPHRLLVWVTGAFFVLLFLLWLGLAAIVLFGDGSVGRGLL
jgi:hypothetical protein